MAVKKTTKAVAEETAATKKSTTKKTAASKAKKATSKKKEEKPADPETKPCGCVGEYKCGEKGDANQAVNIDIKINGKPASAEDIKNIVDALEVIDNVKTFMSKQRAQMEERFKAIQKRFNDFWTF